MSTATPAVATARSTATHEVERNGPPLLPDATRDAAILQDVLAATAKQMAEHDFLPVHLRNNTHPGHTVANCYRICAQARTWKLDPYTVMENSYSVKGQLIYSGTLVAAVVNNSGKLDGRLTFVKSGKGDDFTITVFGTLRGATAPLQKTLRQGDVMTKNEMWDRDPENKLYYSTVRAWVKLHVPELLIGFGDNGSDAAFAAPAGAEEFNELQRAAGVMASSQAAAMTHHASLAGAGTLNFPAEAGQLASLSQLTKELGMTTREMIASFADLLGAEEGTLPTVAQAEQMIAELRRRLAAKQGASPGMDAAAVVTPTAPPVSIPADGEARTLHEAMQEAVDRQAAADAASKPVGLATMDQLRTLLDTTESYFSIFGWGDQKKFAAERGKTWTKILAKYSVATAQHLTVAQCVDLDARLNAKVQENAEQLRKMGVTCTVQESPPAMSPPAAPKS